VMMALRAQAVPSTTSPVSCSRLFHFQAFPHNSSQALCSAQVAKALPRSRVCTSPPPPTHTAVLPPMHLLCIPSWPPHHPGCNSWTAGVFCALHCTHSRHEARRSSIAGIVEDGDEDVLEVQSILDHSGGQPDDASPQPGGSLDTVHSPRALRGSSGTAKWQQQQQQQHNSLHT